MIRTELWVLGRTVSFLILLLSITACSGNADSSPAGPTSPTSPIAAQATPPGAPGNALFSAIDIAQGTLSFSWLRSEGVERYIVEAGSSPGANDLATMTVGGESSSVTLSGVAPRDAIYVRVKGANSAGVGPASKESVISLPDFRDVIEALFFSSGPYGERTIARDSANRMRGYAPGARVSLRVPHEVGGETLDVLIQSVQDMNALMGLNVFIERATVTRSEWDRIAPPGITIFLNQGHCIQPGNVAVACAFSTPIPIAPRCCAGPCPWAPKGG